MDFLKKLFDAGVASSAGDFYTFNVRCGHCNESIEGRINMSDDLSLDDEGGYRARKVLMGSGHCFRQVEVTLAFDASRKLLDTQVSGGKLVE